MRASFRPYLIGVLLPVGLAGLGAFFLTSRAGDASARASLVRMGGLARVIFREEMGQQTAEMATTAPLLENPDPSTPILRAALQGDTVAALGLAGPDLVLSVALAVREEPEGGGQPSPTLQLRAVTRPFPARSLTRFHSRTGLHVALFLRGTLAAAAPPAFGPSLVQGPRLEGRSHHRLVLPVAPSDQGDAPAQLLVESPGLMNGGPTSLQLFFLLCLPILPGLGLSFLLMALDRRGGAEPGKVAQIGLTALPLVGLWFLVAVTGNQARSGAEQIQERDLLRSVALLKEVASNVDPNFVAEGTGFHLLQRAGDSTVSTTLTDEILLDAAMALPPPEADLPTQGFLDSGEERWAFAAARVRPSEVLILLADPALAGPGRLDLHLYGIAGLASLLCLGFPLFRRSAPRERDEAGEEATG